MNMSVLNKEANQVDNFAGISNFNNNSHVQCTVGYILKRDGRKAIFYRDKIVRAVQAAMTSTGIYDQNLAEKVADNVVLKLNQNFQNQIPTVENIQDYVEKSLVELNQFDIAKEYILYRQERSRVRNAKSRLMETYYGIACEEAKKNDLKRENANIDGNTAMGTMLRFGSEGSKEFSKNFLMNPKHVQAHEQGDIHIHDMDFLAMGTLTCCQIDVKKLFETGFSTGHGHLRQPNSIGSYGALAAIALQSNQNEQHGGQSIPNFDYALANGVNKTYKREIRENILKMAHYVIGKKIDSEKLKNVIESCEQNVGEVFSYPHLSDENIDKVLSLLKKDVDVDITKEQFDMIQNEAASDTKRATFQAMEGLVHNLNTMHSRAGAQVPFTSINFGTDTSEAGRLVSEMLLEATWNGLGKGETPIFPISIFKVKDGINYNESDPNYDLFKLAMKVSAKRLFPNFVFLDAPYNLQYYKKGDYESEVATMGCRTRVVGSVFPESDGKVTSRGNLSFTTVNLPSLGIKYGIALAKRKKADMDSFYKDLDSKMDLVAGQLLERFEIQANKRVLNFPFLMGQGIWMGGEKLDREATLRDVIKHGTLSIGFQGLAETLVALTGHHHGESDEAQALGLEIITFMRKKCDELMNKYQLNFSLLATPAEGIAGRFVKIDKNRYGIIPGVTDREYYTNSFHVPVYYAIGAFDKIEKEGPYHALCNAGHITYVELDGDPLQNLEAFEAVIKKMKESNIGYGSVNHPVDRDPVCGFNGIIGDKCPKCGRKEGENGVGFERLRRITGYLTGSLDRWNDAKRAEERDRVKHNV